MSTFGESVKSDGVTERHASFCSTSMVRLKVLDKLLWCPFHTILWITRPSPEHRTASFREVDGILAGLLQTTKTEQWRWLAILIVEEEVKWCRLQLTGWVFGGCNRPWQHAAREGTNERRHGKELKRAVLGAPSAGHISTTRHRKRGGDIRVARAFHFLPAKPCVPWAENWGDTCEEKCPSFGVNYACTGISALKS
jgi:hypothetical protein